MNHTNVHPGVVHKAIFSLACQKSRYAAAVWDQHQLQDIGMIENVQKIALRMCSKQWDTGYSELLNMFDLSSLENQHLYLTLCHLFKIVHGLCYFPPDVIIPKTSSSDSTRHFLLQQPFPEPTLIFIPLCSDCIRKWNNLPRCCYCSYIILIRLST